MTEPTTLADRKRLFTTEQVAERLDMKQPALRAHIHAGHITRPGLKVGTGYLWTSAEVQAARKELARPGRRKPRRIIDADEQAGRHAVPGRAVH